MSSTIEAPAADPLAERRKATRDALALQQTQIKTLEKELTDARTKRRTTILAATAPLEEGGRDGLLSYDEVAVVLEVSKSAAYKMTRGGWDKPGLREQGVREHA